MDTTFQFMTNGQKFAATVPDQFDPQADSYASVSLNLFKHSIQFSPLSRFDDSRFGLGVTRKVLQHGRSVKVCRRQASPALDIAFWNVGSGVLWTQTEPDMESSDAIGVLLKNLVPAVGAGGLPVVSVAAPITQGDIRDFPERDAVIFPALDESLGVWSLAFTYAGALGMDTDAKVNGGIGMATRATDSGVLVTASGSADRFDDLRQLAENAAGSVAPA